MNVLQNFLLIIVALTGLTQCNSKQLSADKTDSSHTQTAIAPKLKPSATFNDTIEITGLSAVFFAPDSIQLEHFKSQNTAALFESTQHDCFYQMRNAGYVMQNNVPFVNKVEAKNHRYLKFIYNNHQVEIIDLNQINDLCGIYLFDGKQKPVLVDMTNIDTALHDYFQGNTSQ
jgi:hypothetical protein